MAAASAAVPFKCFTAKALADEAVVAGTPCSAAVTIRVRMIYNEVERRRSHRRRTGLATTTRASSYMPAPTAASSLFDVASGLFLAGR